MRQVSGRYTFLGSFPADFPETGLPEVAFAGRSNVGKSSCLNRLLGSKKAARVSNTPGRTQLINLFDVMGEFVFADLPGYGFARVPDHVQDRWKGMIEGYLASRGGAIGAEFVTVRTGDSATSIAREQMGIPLWLLQTYNPEANLDRIRPGQELLVPVLADIVVDAEEFPE